MQVRESFVTAMGHRLVPLRCTSIACSLAGCSRLLLIGDGGAADEGVRVLLGLGVL